MKVVEIIREFNGADPFAPYEIHMAGGTRFRVPHPDFVSISPRDSMVVVFDLKDRLHHLNVMLIERVVAAGSVRKRRRAA